MRIIYSIICYIVYYSMLAWIIRRLVARRKVSIILYHDPSPEIFQRHIAYLIRNYCLISLADFVTAVKEKRNLPPYALVITFDDGHRRNYDLLDCIKKNNIKPTIYVCTSIIDTNREFWFRIEGVNSKKIKRLSNEARLKYLEDNFGFSLEKEYDGVERQALSSGEINEMKSYVDFQSHTCYHPILTTCNANEARREIDESANSLKQKYGNEILHFAFPNGDYSEREIEMLKSSGYQSARTTDVGWNDLDSDLFRLKITGVGDHSNLTVLKAELSGVPAYLYNVLTSGLHWKPMSGKHLAESERK